MPDKNPIQPIAQEYFDYLGKHLPQQCISDEFYFLPRAENAMQYMEVLDDLHPVKIKEHIHHVKTLFHKIPSEEMEILEEEIDRSLLSQSMRSFIREFDNAKVWEKDPTLYVKIPLFAVDNILSKEGVPKDQIKTDLLSLFNRLPAFLSLAVKNIRFPSSVALEVAEGMTLDAIRFFRKDVPAFISLNIGEDKALNAKLTKALEGWDRFRKKIHESPRREFYPVGEEGLADIFHISLGYSRSLDEILERARSMFSETHKKLKVLALRIAKDKTWKQLIDEQSSPHSSQGDVLQLYRSEVRGLRRFFSSRNIISFPPGEEVLVLPTPSYLLSLRATASYRAPMTGDSGGVGKFFITPGLEDLGPVMTHSPYLAAHETYPGHHILDHIRVHDSNPIRRQIESPLFYEGWACYGEQLLDEMGYVRNPRRELIGLKRQLWRSLRAILDIRIQTGRITPDRAAEEIEAIGFSSNRARRQVRRFCLTPGYQSCYAIGLHEILRLREKFAPGLGINAFHDILLSGGQIPFHLVEKRLEKGGIDRKWGSREKPYEND